MKLYTLLTALAEAIVRPIKSARHIMNMEYHIEHLKDLHEAYKDAAVIHNELHDEKAKLVESLETIIENLEIQIKILSK